LSCTFPDAILSNTFYRSSGLGQATVQNLALSGAFVANFDLAEPVDISLPGRVKFYKVDITSEKDVHDAVQDTIAWSREMDAPLGGVVCCAGVLAPGKVRKTRTRPLRQNQQPPDHQLQLRTSFIVQDPKCD
jgi:NAD(P)-dependent dehydrogenase (short-subunit alcohol dehydrogenase family)